MSSDPNKLKFSDLGYGFLNNCTDSGAGHSVDRRRANGTDYLKTAIQSVYQPSTMKGVGNTMTGIVMHHSKKQPTGARSKEETLSAFARTSMLKKGWKSVTDFFDDGLVNVYKVYIPEIECRPAPLSFQDPVIFTYYDVYEAPGAIDKDQIPLGSVVTVQFENLLNFKNPQITTCSEEAIAFEGDTGEGGSKSKGENGKSAGSVGSRDSGAGGKSGKKGGSAGTPTPESPAGLQYNEFRNGAPEWTSIQIHYTVTYNTKDAISVLAQRGLSYNYIIARDGTVTMTVDPSKAVARHAGRGDPDQTRIGISFVNLGYESKYAGSGWGGRSSPPIEQWESFPPHDLKWDPYTPAAIKAGKELVKRLRRQFPDIKTIFGHEDTSSGKLDPGPAFDKYWAEYEALMPQGRGSVARSTKKRGSSTRA